MINFELAEKKYKEWLDKITPKSEEWIEEKKKNIREFHAHLISQGWHKEQNFYKSLEDFTEFFEN